MRKRPKRRRPSHYDLQELTKGTSKELGIHAQTVGSVCEQFSRSRDKAKHSLRFHASFGARSARCRFRNRAGRSKATPSPISGSASGILAASAGAPQADERMGCVLRGTEHRQCRRVQAVAYRRGNGRDVMPATKSLQISGGRCLLNIGQNFQHR